MSAPLSLPCLHSNTAAVVQTFALTASDLSYKKTPKRGPGAEYSYSICFFLGRLTLSGLEFDVLLHKYIFLCSLLAAKVLFMWPRASAKYKPKDKFKTFE